MNQTVGLLEEIEALKSKTEQNREMAKEARETAESALTNVSNDAVKICKLFAAAAAGFDQIF